MNIFYNGDEVNETYKLPKDSMKGFDVFILLDNSIKSKRVLFLYNVDSVFTLVHWFTRELRFSSEFHSCEENVSIDEMSLIFIRDSCDYKSDWKLVSEESPHFDYYLNFILEMQYKCGTEIKV